MNNLIPIIFILWIIFKIYKISIYKERFSTNNIFISLTTSPKRILHIEHLLNNLSTQTIKPNKIILNLPFVFKRDNSEFKEIPKFIQNYPLVIINRVEDIGPATKILGSLSIVDNPEDIIISVDDDIEYSKNMIEILYNQSVKNPNAIITGESFMRTNDNKAQLLEGYSGVLYKRKFFNNIDNEKIKNYSKYCSLADDFILSNFMLKNNIPIIVADDNENKTIINAFLEYGNGNDALRNGAHGQSGGNIDNYQKCSKYLKENNELFINYYIKEMFDFLF